MVQQTTHRAAILIIADALTLQVYAARALFTLASADHATCHDAIAR